MKSFRPILLLALVVILAYRDLIFLGKVPLPADTLIGAYYPWLNSKWGYSVGVPVKNPPISDAFSLFFPWKILEAKLFKQFQLPLWNKYSFSGTPLLADYHSAVLFPPNLLFVISEKYGWGLYVLFSTLFCLASMYIFLGGHVKDKLARAIGAIVFAFSGLMTTWVEFGTAIWAIGFLPLALYCLDRSTKSKDKKFLVFLSLAICLLILAGNVQIVIYSVFLISLYIFFEYKQSKLPPFIYIFLGILLATPQLLPTMEFYLRSIRSSEKFSSLFDFGLIPLFEATRLWAADLFGNPTTRNYFGKLDYHETSPFLGTLTLPLVIPLLFNFRKLSPASKFFSCVFLASLFLAFSSPFTKLIYSLPLPLLTYSYASRILFLTSFSASVLLAISLDHLPFEKKNKTIASISSATIFTFSLITIFTLIPEQLRIVSLRNFALPGVLLAILPVILFTKINKQLVLLVIFLLLSFDLLRYFSKQTPFISANLVFPSTPVLDFLARQMGPFRIAADHGPLLPPNTWVYYGLESIEGYDPLRATDYNQLFNIAANGKYSNTLNRFSEIADVNPKFLDLLNVKYFLTLKDSESNKMSKASAKLLQYGYKPIFEEGKVLVLENPSVFSRAFFVSKIERVNNPKELQVALENPQFDPKVSAIVQGDLEVADDISIGQVIEFNHRDNEVEITTRSQGSGFLVLADSFDPGWTVKVNQKPSPIFKVNGALRGVALPSGQNHVLYEYQPNSFKIGLYLSILAGGLIIVMQFVTKDHD